jgi:hypothetical protein
MTSSHLAFRTGRGQAVGPAENCTQNPIDESAGSIAPKSFGKLYGLIDGGLSWYRIIEQNLVDCKPQDIFIDLCHLLQRPLLRGTFNLTINLWQMIQNPLQQFLGKVYHTGWKMTLRSVPLQNVSGTMLGRIIFIQSLQGNHPALPAHANGHLILAPDQGYATS